MSGVQRWCLICNWPCELDDQEATGIQRAICARCFARETGANVHPMPKGLLRDLESALAGIAPSQWID